MPANWFTEIIVIESCCGSVQESLTRLNPKISRRMQILVIRLLFDILSLNFFYPTSFHSVKNNFKNPTVVIYTINDKVVKAKEIILLAQTLFFTLSSLFASFIRFFLLDSLSSEGFGDTTKT